MNHDSHDRDNLAQSLNRRELLGRCGMGFGLIGLAGIMIDDNLLGPSGTANAASPVIASPGPLAPGRRISLERQSRSYTCS